MKVYEIVAYNTSICPGWESAQTEDRVARVGRISAGDQDPINTLESMTDCTLRMLQVLGSPTDIAFGIRGDNAQIMPMPSVLENLRKNGMSLVESMNPVDDSVLDLDRSPALQQPPLRV
jgi:hypothetical protein